MDYILKFENPRVFIISALFSCASVLPVDVRAETDRIGANDTVAESLLTISSRHPAVRRRAGELAAKISKAKYASYFYPDPKFGVVYSNLPSGEFVYNRTPMTGIEFQLRQPIPFPGRLTLKARIADDGAELARLDLAREKNDLARKFLITSIERGRLSSLAALTTNYGRQIRIVSETARTRYAVGRGNLSDLSRANLMHSKYLQRAERFRGLLKGADRRLDYFRTKEPAGLEGTDANTNGDESREPAAERDSGAIGETLSRAAIRKYVSELNAKIEREHDALASRSLDLARAKIMVRTGGTRASLAKLDYLPDFELFAAYRQRDAVPNDPVSGEDFTSIGLSMRLPLWSAFTNHHQVRAEKKARQSRQFAERDVQSRILATAGDLQARQQSLAERIQMYRTRLLPQARRARSSAQLAYQTGGVDFDTLLGSWDTLYMQKAELLELEAQHDRVVVDLATLYNLVLPEVEANSEHETREPTAGENDSEGDL